jgi:two-component sensor histidine kinase
MTSTPNSTPRRDLRPVDNVFIQLLILGAIGLLPLLGFGAYLLFRADQVERTSVEAGLEQQAVAISGAIDRLIETQIRVLETTATTSALDEPPDLEAFYREAVRVRARNDRWMTIVLAEPVDGQQIVNLLRPLGASLPRSARLETIQWAAETRQPQVFSLVDQTGPVAGLPLVGIRVPVLRQDSVPYVLTAVMSLEALQAALVSQDVPQSWVLALLNEEDLIMARNRRHEEFRGHLATADLRAAIARSQMGLFTATTQEGTSVYTAFHRSSLTGWVLALGVPNSEADAARRRSLLLLWTGAVASLLAAGVLVVLIGRAFAQQRAERERIRTAEIERQQLVTTQRALAEREVLLREVHHRVKNNLQVIAALLRIQARGTEPKAQEPLFESIRRINAMGRIHEQLYRAQDFANIDLGRYLTELAAQAAASYGGDRRGIETLVQSDPVTVDLDTATPLGLIVSELLSNAYKHAFPADQPGRIEVICRRTAEAVELTVRDNGVGTLPADQQPDTIGNELVRRLAEQIGAMVAAHTEGGTVVNVQVPWPLRKAAANAAE